MKAAVLHALGTAPRCEDFADPTPNEDEALVSVKAASLKASDKMIADGSHYDSIQELPAVVGLDGVGVLADGTRVYCGGPRAPHGTMAGADRRAAGLLPTGTGRGGRSDGSGSAEPRDVVRPHPDRRDGRTYHQTPCRGLAQFGLGGHGQRRWQRLATWEAAGWCSSPDWRQRLRSRSQPRPTPAASRPSPRPR
jgi:hypothetical protein